MGVIKKDGWLNVLTGLGIQGRDKSASTVVRWEPMDQRAIEDLADASVIAQKIIGYPIRDAFKKQPTFSSDLEDPDFNENLWDWLREKERHNHFLKATLWGNTYGAAYIVMGIIDGKDPSEPVDVNNISSIAWTQVLHKYELTPLQIDWDISSPTYRQPLTYQYALAGMSTSEASGPIIHRSRVIVFNGRMLSDNNYQRNNYTHDSMLNSVKEDIRSYESAYGSTATLLNDHSSGIFKMQNLANLIGAGQDQAVMTRLSLVDTTRSNVKSVVIDADESFERSSASLAGLDQALSKMDDKLVATAEIPHTIMLGEGSSGSLSGEGQNEIKQYADRIVGEQKEKHKPKYLEYLKMLLAAKDNELTSGVVPERLNMKFPPYMEMDPKEKALIYKSTAEADAIYIDRQVMSPDEPGKRFREEGFEQDLEIDQDLRTQDFTDFTDPDNQVDLTANLPPEGLE